jgi:dihydropyrimidinase
MIITSENSFRADIGIEKGIIKAIAPKLDIIAKEDIDVAGMLVMPGVIDSHVHFQLPVRGLVSIDDFENGTKASACGGVTTIIDFATQAKGESLFDAVANRRAQADGRVAIDYALHLSPTDWTNRTKKEIPKIMAGGITSFKLYMTYAEAGLMSSDANLCWALDEMAKSGGMITVHAESDGLLDLFINRYHNIKDMKKYGAYCQALSRPNIVEAEAVARAALFAEATGGRLYIVHMSTRKAVNVVARVRKSGVKIYAETCPQYLLLDDSVFKRRDGHLYTTCPQVKKRKDSEALWQGLRNKAISTIATDTCTFTKKQKDSWKGDFTKIPYGIPGVETLLPLLYTFGVGRKKISINRMVELLAVNPAKLFGLYPRKGIIKIGSDADLVIFDPQKKVAIKHENLQTNCDWSPYEGLKLTGYPHLTLSRGKIVAIDGKFTGQKGHGRFLKREVGTDL